MSKVITPFHLLWILSLIVLYSCTPDYTYREIHSFGESLEWRSTDTVEFAIPVNDNKAPYLFEMTFRCASGFAYDKMLVRLEETAPNGKVIRRDVEIEVRNADGSFNGEKGFDIIDLTTTISPDQSYPVHGTYTYRVWQTMGMDVVHFPMEVGLQLSRPEAQ
jgi:gliding motility-associated lipoprotein GldH